MDKTSNIFGSCLVCGKELNYLGAKFCSRKCKSDSQKGKPAWNKGLTKDQYIRKDVVLSNKCLNCGKPVLNKFCDHHCQTVFQNKQQKGKTYVEIYGEKAQSIRNKRAKSIKEKAIATHFTCKGASVVGNQRRGLKMEDFYGEEKAEQVKQQIRESLAAFRKTPEGIKIRLATGERNIQLALSGKDFANTKKGYFEDIYFGSSLEESFLQECFRVLGTLKNVQRNVLVVTYDWESCTHKTIPDYSIVDNNGVLLALVECKWERYMADPVTFRKAKALFHFGKQNQFKTGYFTYNTLNLLKRLQGNPDPRQLNTLLSYMEIELYNYVVSCKEQRLSVEEEGANKTLKNIVLANNILNDPVPCLRNMI